MITECGVLVCYSLNYPQSLLPPQSYSIACDLAVTSDNPVAGDENGDMVIAVGPRRSDRLFPNITGAVKA